MASNIAELAKNIKDSIVSLIQGNGIFGNSSGDPSEGQYPKISSTNILNEIDQSNWTKNLPYTFSVMGGTDVSLSLTTTATFNSAGIPQTSQSEDNIFTDFPLPINPTDLSQDETFAIKIQTTQGGTAIQQGGNKYGDLTISGTTGINPFRGAGGADKLTGEAVFQPNQLKYRSGYEVFLRLRNWFKAYYQLKHENQDTFRDTRLVFKNFKDGEFLVVELLKFSLKRSGTRPNLYDYTLQFKVLGRSPFKVSEGQTGFFGEVDNIMNIALDKITTARGIFLRSQDILRQVESTYESTVLEGLRQATLAIKAFTGVGTVAADMSKKAITSTVSSEDALIIAAGLKSQQNAEKISGSVTAVSELKLPSNLKNATLAQGATLIVDIGRQNDVLMEVNSSTFPVKTQNVLAEEQSTALSLHRSYYEDVKAQLIRVRDNTADKVNLGSTTYNTQYDRVSSSNTDPLKQVSDKEFELLSGFDLALEGLDYFLSTSVLFKSTYSDRISTIKSSFTDDLPAVQDSPAVKQIVMPHNTDLERLALIHLGNPERWIEISEVNNLKPPYVVQDMSDTSDNVIHPGDKILIPQPLINGFGNTPTAVERFINEALSEVEKNLGIDFKLTSTFDLDITNKGDLQVVKGGDNAAQAVVLKLNYEKGDLLEHPELGVGLQIGGKMPSAVVVKTSLIQTLTADPRFDKVENVQILERNSELRLEFLLRIKKIDIPIPVSMKL